MGLQDRLRQLFWNFLIPSDVFDQEKRERQEMYDRYRSYYEGKHKRQIKQKQGQADDNLIENYCSLIIERSISMMLGDGVKFELPDETSQDLINEILKANKYRILFHESAQNACIYGTGFFKMIPDGAESKDQEDKMLTRIVSLDPRWMHIITEQEDVGSVIGYDMIYVVGERARKEETRIGSKDESTGEIQNWIVSNFEANAKTGGNWELIAPPVNWGYEFPPIVHWKNLPNANDVYGQSDLEDAIPLQDRINFVSGNISKILRYHAHPKTWGRGSGLGDSASWGADEIVMVNGDDSMLANLEMQSDLASSREYRNDLKAALFDISRTVDLSSMKDKIGQLTNFGLRVLYNDSLDKLSTKRDLFGEALTELIHRILVIEGAASVDPGKIQWPEPLPVNETEQNDTDRFEIESGLISKETVSTRRGNDWEKEQERIEEERVSEDNIGAALLRAFNQGQ